MNTVPCITIDILSCRKEKIQIKWQKIKSDKKDQIRTILLFKAEKVSLSFWQKDKTSMYELFTDSVYRTEKQIRMSFSFRLFVLLSPIPFC